jgi:hypothetical protein
MSTTADAWAQLRELMTKDLQQQDPERQRRERQWREAEAARRRLAARLREVEDGYGCAEFAWREDPEALERYVAEHKADLLDRREEIVLQYEAFHADRSFIDHLRQERPALYARVTPVFRYRALAVALRPALPAETSVDSPDGSGPHEHAQRLRRLIERYGTQEFAWRENQEQVEAYARRHAQELLSDKRRAEILSAHERFHAETVLIDLLKNTRPDIYQRADEVFCLRVLALAESMDTEKPRFVPTPGEYRRRMLNRLRVHAEDLMSRTVAIESMVQKYRDELEALNLDPDEIDEKVQLLRELLMQDDTAASDSSFKQV